MSKKFVLATDPLTAEQEQALEAKIGSMGFWHWLPNFWLLKSLDDTMTTAQIRQMVQEINPSARCFVSEVQPSAWAARTKPDAKGNDMGAWIRSDWETP